MYQLGGDWFVSLIALFAGIPRPPALSLLKGTYPGGSAATQLIFSGPVQQQCICPWRTSPPVQCSSGKPETSKAVYNCVRGILVAVASNSVHPHSFVTKPDFASMHFTASAAPPQQPGFQVRRGGGLPLQRHRNSRRLTTHPPPQQQNF